MANDINPNNTENEHLLEHSWALWFRPPAAHNASQQKQWKNSQQLYFKAKTVEQFWRGFHSIPRIRPAHPLNCDYSLFKEGVDPAWEDEFNQHGGRWTYSIDRRPSSAGNVSLPSVIEQLWLDVMLCLIGEGFDPYGDQIAGGVCGIRNPRNKQDREPMGAKLHIWTTDASNIEANMKIGQILKEVLHAPDGQLLFTPHETKSNARNSYNHNQNLKL